MQGAWTAVPTLAQGLSCTLPSEHQPLQPCVRTNAASTDKLMMLPCVAQLLTTGAHQRQLMKKLTRYTGASQRAVYRQPRQNSEKSTAPLLTKGPMLRLSSHRRKGRSRCVQPRMLDTSQGSSTSMYAADCRIAADVQSPAQVYQAVEAEALARELLHACLGEQKHQSTRVSKHASCAAAHQYLWIPYEELDAAVEADRVHDTCKPACRSRQFVQSACLPWSGAGVSTHHSSK